jgi:phosphoglycerate-specific signal transduction histidine kinase
MSTPDKNPSPADVPAAMQPDDASLHKIREILVGPTTRAIDERLDEFRKQIDTANQKSRQEVGTRLEALEKQLRSEFEHQQVKNGAAVEQISKAQAETREWIQRELELVRVAMDHTFASLRAEFVDRQSMASLFSEMSLRVASDSGAPIDPNQPDDDFEVMTDRRKKT